MMGATCGGNSADAGGGWVEASMYQGVSWREKWKGGGVAVQIGTGEWGGRASPYVNSMDDTKEWRARESKRFCTFKDRASVFSPQNDTRCHAFDHRFVIARKLRSN